MNKVLFQRKRCEWIDNARVLAAIIVMYIHVPGRLAFENGSFGNVITSNLISFVPYCGSVPLFLILSGYFLSRNISWTRAWHRFIWLLIPYAFWNAVVYFTYQYLGYTQSSASSVMGIGSVFTETFAVSENPIQYPIIGPSWFLRDIMLLTLLTPLFVKCRIFLPAILFIFASFSQLNMEPNPWVTLSIGTCLLYMLGVALSCFSLDELRRVFTPAFSVALVLGALVGVGVALKNTYLSGDAFLNQSWSLTMVGLVFGAMMIAHCGVLIEKHLPSLSCLMSHIAPACFLVFMLHRPIFNFLRLLLPECIVNSYGAFLIPIPVFLAIVAFFLFLKRYLPALLPYLAHEKHKH